MHDSVRNAFEHEPKNILDLFFAPLIFNAFIFFFFKHRNHQIRQVIQSINCEKMCSCLPVVNQAHHRKQFYKIWSITRGLLFLLFTFGVIKNTAGCAYTNVEQILTYIFEFQSFFQYVTVSYDCFYLISYYDSTKGPSIK